jgi:hypothetical protein
MPSVDRHMSRDLLTVEAGLPVVAVAQRMADRNVGRSSCWRMGGSPGS